MEKPKRVKNYVNNADLLTQIRLSKEQDKMTEELGKMIIMLCERYSSHPTYANIYYNKDDMVAFAIMTLTKAWKAFNEEKSNNPFSYFTQIAKNAFYQYLNSERDHKRNKDIILAHIIPDDTLMEWWSNSNQNFQTSDDIDQHEAYDIDFREVVVFNNKDEDPDKIDIEKELDNTPVDIESDEVEIDDEIDEDKDD